MSDVEISEDELFEGAVSDEATDDLVVTEQPERAEPVRDEAGRFAVKEEPEVVAETLAEQPAVDDNAAQVPSWRVREIREERDALRRQLEEVRRQPAAPQPTAQVQQPVQAEGPDPLLDPIGYAKHVREEIRQEILNDRRESSLQLAARTYKDEFAEAYSAATKAVDPALRARMQQSPDPGETLIQWHREQKTMREVGNDPNAWLEKKLEERLNDPAFLAKAIERSRSSASQQTTSNGRPRIDLPPSLNGASRSNAALRAANSDVSDEALFQELAG